MTTPDAQDGAQKDPEEWTTGDEPITDPQKSYLSTLAQDAGIELDLDNMSKSEASEKIDELRGESDRITGEE